MKMNKANFYSNLSASIIIAAVFFLISYYSNHNPKYQFQMGQIAQQSIKAPFSFTVYKSENQIQQEIYQSIKNLSPIYKISEDAKFKVQKELDYFFIELNNVFEANDTLNFLDRFSKMGYQLNHDSYQYLKNTQKRQFLYNFLTAQINTMTNRAIYDQTMPYNMIRFSENNQIKEKSRNQLLSVEEAKREIIASSNSTILKNVLDNILDNFQLSNLEKDEEASEAEKQKIRKTINPVISKVNKDETIINKNQKITDQDLLTIESLLKAYKEKKIAHDYTSLLLSSLGMAMLNLVLFYLYFLCIKLFFNKAYQQEKHRYVLLLMFLINAVITMVIYNSFQTRNLSVIPFSLFVIVCAFLFNPAYAFLFSTFNLVLLGQYSSWNSFFIVCSFISSIFAIYAIKKNSRVNYYLIFIYMLAGYFIALTALSLYRNESLMTFGMNMFYGTISCFISVFGAIILLPIIEKQFSFASKQTLLELMDFNKPLMKQLAKEAPGTYYHSLIVGNLAEAAAEAIQANPLIARIGSYYHDIGKLSQPDVFIENNQLSTQFHEKIPPIESAKIIKNHVINGVKLAKQYKLPDFIIEIIIQHHGDNRIKYFYHKAINSEENVNEQDYMYSGPKPRTKEAALVMIADIIESTTKSLNEYSTESIKKVMDNTILSLLQEGQLDEAPLTIKDLAVIKQEMLPILQSIYRKRIEYPEEKNE